MLISTDIFNAAVDLPTSVIGNRPRVEVVHGKEEQERHGKSQTELGNLGKARATKHESDKGKTETGTTKEAWV